MLRVTRVQEYCLGYIGLGACLASLSHEGHLWHSMGEVSCWGVIAPFQQGEVFHPCVPSTLEFDNLQVYPALENMLQEGDCIRQGLEETNSRTRDSREPI